MYQQPLKRPQRCCLAWRISVRPKRYEQVRIHPVRPLVSLSRQAGRDFPKWTCPVSTKILSARSLPFRPKHANGFYCAVGTSVISPRWVFTTIFCWFRQAHASSAGDMMAVRQTPLSCSLLICNHCSMEHSFIQHHHILQRGDYPAFGSYSCIFALFSLGAMG